MIIAITIMITVTAATIIAFIIANPRSVPVLAGQRWLMPGLGNILVAKTIGSDASFGKNVGRHANVKYQLENGEYGYCTKSEIRATGQLLPYNNRTERDVYIQNILDTVRERKQGEWKPYAPPPGWRPSPDSDEVYDAEIITPTNSNSKKSYGSGMAIVEDLD